MPIELRPLTLEERAEIQGWPPYPPPYEALDYALRLGGWLDTYTVKAGCIALGAHAGGELVGFSLLVPDYPDSAEFYVAVKGNKLAHGFGKKICIETLKTGFQHLPLQKIHLKVRKNHEVGIRLYADVGFVRNGEISEVTNHILTDFYVMEITRAGAAAYTRSAGSG